MLVARFCLVAIAAVALCMMRPGLAVSRGFGTSGPYVVISGPITKSSPAASTETQPTVTQKPKSKHGKGGHSH
jgi:hypothetical protein